MNIRSGNFNPLPPHGGRQALNIGFPQCSHISIHSLRMEGDAGYSYSTFSVFLFQSTPSAWRETIHVKRYRLRVCISIHSLRMEGDASGVVASFALYISIHSLRMEGDYSRAYIDLASGISIHSLRMEGDANSFFSALYLLFQSTPSAWRETHGGRRPLRGTWISIHSLRMEGDSKTAQESVFHFAYPCTILQKRMQKTTFCTRKNGFFRKKGEKFGAKPSASFCAPMIRTDTFPLNFSHRISGSSMSMVSFAPICSTFD